MKISQEDLIKMLTDKFNVDSGKAGAREIARFLVENGIVKPEIEVTTKDGKI